MRNYQHKRGTQEFSRLRAAEAALKFREGKSAIALAREYKVDRNTVYVWIKANPINTQEQA